ncbi:MAG: MFS transporter, partial [Chloroflexi bacterium]|nr:MFS transporter [Chloroflexota bacterium]
LWLLRMTAVIPIGAVAGGLLLGKGGARPVVVIGLALVAVGLLLASNWGLDVGEPELTLHLALAGFGFGLVIAPILVQALSVVVTDYRATAASLVVVARMLGMTLGLAALSAWGVEQFHVLTAGLELPLPQPGEDSQALQARLVEYQAGLNSAVLSLFHNFLRVAGGVALVAILPALALRVRREEGGTGIPAA